MIRKLALFILPLLVLLVPAVVFAQAADPSIAITAAADAGWDAFVKVGPIWGGLLVVAGLLRTFLNKQHWLAQGKLLSGLTGVSMVLAAVAAWRFMDAPASGILTALLAGYGLVTHSTVPGAQPAAKASEGGFAARNLLFVLGMVGLIGIAVAASGCGSGLTTKGVAVAGKEALIDCGETEARNLLVQRVAPVVLQVLLNSTSPDGKLIDTTPVKSAIGKIDKGDAYDEARIVLTCAAKLAFAKLSTPAKAAPDAPQSAALVIDQAAVRRAEADVMATVAPGTRFAAEVK